MAFSPDGKTILTDKYREGTARLWNANDRPFDRSAHGPRRRPTAAPRPSVPTARPFSPSALSKAQRLRTSDGPFHR